MALFSLPPSAPQADLDLGLFLGGKTHAESSMTLTCTLAPEWFPQSGVQLTWPHAGTDWVYMLQDVTECYIRLAFEIATREPLLVVAPDVESVQRLLEEKLPSRATQNIRYFACETNDTWARDHGFLTLVTNDGPQLLDFRFNGWGGKFAADKDNAINAQLAQTDLLNGHYVDCLDFELEGGSIETDGNGTLLTTAECLLNPNRNGGRFVQADVERILGERLGVDHFLWLHHGYLAGDDTDSHVDTLARLCPNDTIAYVKCTDETDEHFGALAAMEQELQAFRTKNGQPYRLVPLPMAEAAFDEDGARLPATYANYLVMDGTVLYPTYGQEETDKAAAAAIRLAYPDRDVVGVDCRALIRQHGSLHCATMQFPRGVFKA